MLVFRVAPYLLSALIFSTFPAAVQARGNQLSLADILIALRSKKVTLPERNSILADAIQSRGTTFNLTPEIERELSGGGAAPRLIDSIRTRGQIIKTSAVTASPASKSIDSVANDSSFYEKRALESSAKGDVDSALIDFTKAIEMNAGAEASLLGRAAVYFGKNMYSLALADYSKVIDNNSRNSAAYSRRAMVYEKKGMAELAAADYKEAFKIEPTNEAAKAFNARIEVEEAKERERLKAAEKLLAARVPAPSVALAPIIPEFVELGVLGESHAIRMVKPIYSDIALKSKIGGRVEIEVVINRDGDVMSAKAKNGHQFLRQNSEDAAKKCKFKPATFGGQAVKAKGVIVYNFVAAR